MLLFDWLAGFWSWINYYGSAIGAVAGMAAAGIAIVALMRSSADNRSRSQPMVTAAFRFAPHNVESGEFVIRNYGPTPARDLEVTFDPPIELPNDEANSDARFILKRYESPIPVLNPGEMLTNTWWVGTYGAGEELVNVLSTPDEVRVTVRYRGIGRRQIIDTYRLSIGFIANTTWTTSSSSLKGRLGTIDGSLKEIATHLRSIATKQSAKSGGVSMRHRTHPAETPATSAPSD